MKARQIHRKKSPVPVSSGSLETVKELLQLVENLRGPATEAPSQNEGTEMPDDWAQQVVDALLNRIVRRIPLAGKSVKTKVSAEKPVAGESENGPEEEGQIIPGEHCPFSGLNRSQIYELMGQGLLKTVTLKKPHEKHGARFYYVGSALEHLDRLAVKQALKPGNKKNHGKSA